MAKQIELEEAACRYSTSKARSPSSPARRAASGAPSSSGSPSTARRVVVSSRKAPACQEVADAINPRHGAGRAIAIPANISVKDDLRRLVEETDKAFGKIDILVCNAASNPYYGPMGGISDDQFRKILDNNVIANHWLIGFAAPQMKARKDGAIIIVSSIGGLKGERRSSAPTTSPRPPTSSSRAISRVEFGPHNVRVNCIAPGLIKTDFARALWDNPGDPEGDQRAHAARAHRRCPTRSPARRCSSPPRPAPS